MKKNIEYNHSVGLIIEGEKIQLTLMNHKTKVEKSMTKNIIDLLRFIEYNRQIKETIFFVEEIDLITNKFNAFKLVKSYIEKYTKYKRSQYFKKRIQFEKYDFPQLQSDFFFLLDDYAMNISKSKTIKIIKAALHLKGLKVIFLSKSEVLERVKVKPRIENKKPISYPSILNGNSFIVKSRISGVKLTLEDETISEKYIDIKNQANY
jgi:hypothetical protein